MSAEAQKDWCSRAGEFADGELASEEEVAFREHLATCGPCQARVFDAMMLDVAAEPAASAARASAVVSRADRRPRRRRFVAMTALLAAAAVLLLFAWKRIDRNRPVELALAPTRSFEPRLSWPGADRYRPIDVMRGERKPEPITTRTLVALQRGADARALAAGELLVGEPAAAAAALAQAPATADVASDRAAVALVEGDAARALSFAAEALRAQPSHPQARWNRALSLRDLGLSRAAAEDFDAFARVGEVGWSREALARADELRAQLSNRALGESAAATAATARATAEAARAALAAGRSDEAVMLARRAYREAQPLGDSPAARLALTRLAQSAAAAQEPALAEAARRELTLLAP